jgi:hypothetical protein
MASTVVIPYSPRSVFIPYHFRKQRWAALVAHRRCGKTVACVNDTVKAALECQRLYPPPMYAYIAPLLKQAKTAAWEYLKHYSRPVQVDKNESDLWVQLRNGARITVLGADNPDGLRGAYLDGAVLDEYADMRPGVWGEVVRPMLADYKGWATFIGTPKGRNEFRAIVERAQSDPNWFHAILRASETGVLPQEELDEAAKDMTPEQYAQEFECSFDAAILGAYYGREIADAEREGRIGDVPVAPELPVHTAWDLGIGDDTAIWFFQVVGGEIRVVDYYANHGQAIPHYVAELAARGYQYGTDWVPHDARVRSLETGRTRVETLIAAGRKPRLVPDHKRDDGINALRLTLPRMWFDEAKTRDGVEALRQYRREYDEKTKAFKDHPRHDWTSHAADAARYLAMAWRELKPEAPPPERKTISIGSPTNVSLNDLWNARPTGRGKRI